MSVGQTVVYVIACLVALGFTAMIIFLSKGDPMSGGGQIRTTFKGRATYDDQIAKMMLGTGVLFVVLMLVLDFLAARS